MEPPRRIQFDVNINYYESLELTDAASMEEIRTAYKTLSKQHHPDKSDDPNSKEKFQRIQAAYEVLYDYPTRREYDNSREGMRQGRGGMRGGMHMPQGMHPFASRGGMPFIPHNVFHQMNSDMVNRGGIPPEIADFLMGGGMMGGMAGGVPHRGFRFVFTQQQPQQPPQQPTQQPTPQPTHQPQPSQEAQQTQPPIPQEPPHSEQPSPQEKE